MYVCVSSASMVSSLYPEVAKSIGMIRGHAAGFRREIESSNPLAFDGIGERDDFTLLAPIINREYHLGWFRLARFRRFTPT